MKKFYILKFDNEGAGFDEISKILNIETKTNNGNWEFQIVETEFDEGVNFIDIFCNILENKNEELNVINVKPSDFSIWYLYEYDGQCNIEFNSEQLYRIGKLGITLCISYWES